ncbi:MAG TPA: IS66 family transposase [Victivallales bacterium]|nr:IS66 family transposase [Victivallales bacterium]
MVTEVKNLKEEITELKSTIDVKDSKILKLQEQLDWFKLQMFGRKSERVIDVPCNTPDLPGFDFINAEKEIQQKVHIKAHDKRKSVSRKGEFKLEIGDNIPIVEKYIDIPDEDKFDIVTGKALTLIGYDKSDKLATKAEQHFILRTLRPKYTLKEDSLYGIIQPKADDCIIEGSKFDASFMSYVVCEKFCHHMPLYRIEEKLKYQNIKISRQVLTSLVIELGLRVQVLVDLMKEELFKQNCIFTDQTSVKFIADRYSKAVNGSIWIYAGNKTDSPPYQIYEFTDNYRQINTIEYLKDFKGIIHADAYKGYVNIDKVNSNINWAACWCHGRRKFEELGVSEFRTWILKDIRKLFLYDRVGWIKNAEFRLKVRKQREKPIVDRIFKKLKEKLVDPKLLPKSKLCDAIKYMLAYEKNFRLYLDNPDIKMDNNTSERALRKIVIGRKNWMYLGSRRSGKAMANHMTLVQSCRAMDINPNKYLEFIYRNLMSYPHKQLHELLPDRWKIMQNR